jgi:hypothetical protein
MGAHPLAIGVFSGLPMMVLMHTRFGCATAGRGLGLGTGGKRQRQRSNRNERKKLAQFALPRFCWSHIQPQESRLINRQRRNRLLPNSNQATRNGPVPVRYLGMAAKMKEAAN